MSGYAQGAVRYAHHTYAWKYKLRRLPYALTYHVPAQGECVGLRLTPNPTYRTVE